MTTLRTLGTIFTLSVLLRGLPLANATDISQLTISNVLYVSTPVGTGYDPGDNRALAISSSGTVLGEADFLTPGVSGTQVGGFTETRGVYLPFNVPDGYQGFGGINNDGTIIGQSYGPFGIQSVGFIGKPGAFTTFQYPGAYTTYPTAINNAGVVVGSYTLGYNQPSHGFLYQNGVFTDFNVLVPGLTNVSLTGLNDAGHIVGTSSSGPFIYANGTIDSLFANPNGINNLDQITITNGFHGSNVLDYHGSALSIIVVPNGPFGPSSNTGEISDAGAIVQGGPYVLTPAPEPESVWLIVPAGAAVLFWAWRRGF